MLTASAVTDRSAVSIAGARPASRCPTSGARRRIGHLRAIGRRTREPEVGDLWRNWT
jgi:hypothetical protein